MRLENKTVLITGGGSGIGQEMAGALVWEGAKVLICGRSPDRLQAAAAELECPPERLSYRAADVTRSGDLQALVQWIEKRWGRLDVLVNNAGILGVMAPIANYPDSVWEEVIRINLSGVFLTTKAVLPLMIRSGGGSIINIISSVGRKGRSQWGAYAVSKFGVEGLSQVLADEVSQFGIRVNTVNPGGTRTPMRAAAYPEEDPEILPTPRQIMPVFIYLASDESKTINGQTFDARDWTGPGSP